MKKSITQKPTFNKVLSVALALLMLVANLAGNNITFRANADTTAPSRPTYILDAAEVAAKTYTENTAVGTEKGESKYFTINALTSGTVVVDANSKPAMDGITFTTRIKLGGKGDPTYRSISFTTGSGGLLTVYAMAGSTGTSRDLTLYKGTTALTTQSFSGDTFTKHTFDIPEAGTYYFYGATACNIYYMKVVEEVYVFNASDLNVGDLTDPTFVGTENFFTVNPAPSGTAVAVDANTKAMDGLSFTKRLKLGGAATLSGRSVSFTTSGAATLTVYAMSSSSDNRVMVLKSNGNPDIEKPDIGGAAISKTVFDIDSAGTYALGSKASGLNIYYLKLSAGAPAAAARKAWNEVAAPSFGNITQNGSKIKVEFNAEFGNDGADSLSVKMLKGETEIASATSVGVAYVEFTPFESANYTFTMTSSRNEEGAAPKSATTTPEFQYVLPLAKPDPRAATNANQQLKIAFDAVKEATSYDVYLKLTEADESEFKLVQNITTVQGSKEYNLTTEKLTVNSSYSIKVVANRDGTKSENTINAIVRPTEEFDWKYVVFGESADAKKNSYSGSVYDELKLTSSGGGGKLLTSGTDGMGFYYVPVAKENNFILNAKVHIDTFTPNGAQEGFVVMARDAEPINNSLNALPNNNYQFSNSYGFIASKVEYNFDSDTREYNTLGDQKISMRNGIAVRSITNISATVGTVPPTKSEDPNNSVIYETIPLDTSCIVNGAGNHNLLGNYTSKPTDADAPNLLTDFNITLKKTNTGFHIIYTDAKGNKQENICYDWEEMFKIDKDHCYVGFGVARDMTISISDISFSISDAATDPAAEPRPTKIIPLSTKINSADVSGVLDYSLRFVANCDGAVSVRSDSKVFATNVSVLADKEVVVSTTLKDVGTTAFEVTFVPDQNYNPGPYKAMNTKATQTINHLVNYRKIGATAQNIYVSTAGRTTNNGSPNKPIDIATAFKYAQPGQTILLGGGTYDLTSTLTIPRGINGTAEARIVVMPDPNATSRPILDFNQTGGGLVHWGDYWTLKGFDVTKTANTQKGIQISGNHNILAEVNAYRNGNTGIQISGTSTETIDKWPSNNLILNCNSYYNMDRGDQDADGFAAKLTCGYGNVFDGCIAHHNSDDGWDLFAKAESGPIGAVTVKNCVAYKNGYHEDETEAGNGNGFKLGGTSIIPKNADGTNGNHLLINSIVYDNKTKGIDTNSCPAVKVVNCTTFNNGKNNVALYTNSDETFYEANGIISFKNASAVANDAENIKLLKQNNNSVYTKDCFYWDKTKSVNTNGADSIEITEEMFKSLDTTIIPARYSDGSINMKNLLQLTDAAIAMLAQDEIEAGAVFAEGLSSTIVLKPYDTDIDGFAPNFVFDSSIPTNAKVGDIITIKYDVSDNVDSKENLDISFLVYINNKLVITTDNTFTLTDVGTCVIKAFAGDAAGNVDTKEMTITITAAPADKTGCKSTIEFDFTITLTATLLLLAVGIFLNKKRKINF